MSLITLGLGESGGISQGTLLVNYLEVDELDIQLDLDLMTDLMLELDENELEICHA